MAKCKELRMRRSLVKLSGLGKSVTKMVTGYCKSDKVALFEAINPNWCYLIYECPFIAFKYSNNVFLVHVAIGTKSMQNK